MRNVGTHSETGAWADALGVGGAGVRVQTCRYAELAMAKVCGVCSLLGDGSAYSRSAAAP